MPKIIDPINNKKIGILSLNLNFEPSSGNFRLYSFIFWNNLDIDSSKNLLLKKSKNRKKEE